MGVLNLRVLVLSAALACSVSCVPTFDDNLPLIDSPKVLAVSSEPAEAAPGDEVQLTALVATPDVNGAQPKLSWGLCIARKPLTELGPVNPVCIQAADRAPGSIIPLGTGASVQATVPNTPVDACRLFGPSLPEPMNGEPAGRPVDPDPTGGYYQPVGVTLLEDSVTTLGAVRIFCPPSGLDQDEAGAFNIGYKRNLNPIIDSVRLLGASGSSPVPDEPEALHLTPGQVVQLEASWAACSDGMPCSGAESYVLFNSDSRQLEQKHESIRISWFATAGRFDNAVTGRDESEFALSSTDNTWTAPTAAQDVRLWLVIRDARGGQTFKSFVVSVKP
jgi:hypothetical protein